MSLEQNRAGKIRYHLMTLDNVQHFGVQCQEDKAALYVNNKSKDNMPLYINKIYTSMESIVDVMPN